MRHTYCKLQYKCGLTMAEILRKHILCNNIHWFQIFALDAIIAKYFTLYNYLNIALYVVTLYKHTGIKISNSRMFSTCTKLSTSTIFSSGQVIDYFRYFGLFLLLW